MASKGKVITLLDTPEKAIKNRARNLPIFKCYITDDWQESQLTNVIVSRKHVNGNITVGMYLVDLLCLGVKDSTYIFNEPENKALNFLYSDPNHPFIEIEYHLAHNIIFAGLEFAEELGLKPCKEFGVSQYILEEDTDDIPLIEI